MKKLSLLSILLLVGCSSTPVSVKMHNPYDFPQSLLEDCKDPELINPESKLSDVLKTMIENNTKSTECRVMKKALSELVQKRKEMYDNSTK